MGAKDRKGPTIYKVVVNHEEQYSIWPADRANRRGWKDEGKTGTERACLAYIRKKTSQSARPTRRP